ncbi:MAG: CheR family methyltransferase [Phycisphaerales bacterium]|jgi:chemotaxis methyl-accepting protein methylase
MSQTPVAAQARATITGEQFQALAELVADRSGLVLAINRQTELTPSLLARVDELGLESFAQYLTLLTTGPLRNDEFQSLLPRLSPSDDSFFGHEQQLGTFEASLLPQMLESRRDTRRLRIFCAACGTGRDAYTLAMIIHRTLGVRIMDWCVEIYGCDLHRQSIDVAERGVFDADGVQSVPEVMRLRYFSQHEGRYAVSDEITQMLGFEAIDLRDRAGIGRHGRWDAIVCRDTLGGFDERSRAGILGMFHEVLADDGVLLVGETEILPPEQQAFTPLPDRRLAGYRKA